MSRGAAAVLLASLLAAFPLGGCGSSKSSTTTSGTAPVAPAAPAAPAAPSTPSLPTGAASLKQAAAACTKGIKESPSITGSLKAKAETICADVGAGNISGAHKAAEAVCKEVITTSALPTSAKEEAQAACKTELGAIAK